VLNGSGRDAWAFMQRGYHVDAGDGSHALAQLASARLGVTVRHQDLRSLTDENRFDGIWISAVLLHISHHEIDDVLRRLAHALKLGVVVPVADMINAHRDGLGGAGMIPDRSCCTSEQGPRCAAQYKERAHAVAMPLVLQRLLSVVAQFLCQGLGNRTRSHAVRIIHAAPSTCIVWKPRRPYFVVRCIQGTAWITMAGDPRDHVLRTGDLLVLRGRGLTALQALGLVGVECAVSESASFSPTVNVSDRSHPPIPS